MLSRSANRRARYIVSSRAPDLGEVGTWEELPCALDSTCPDHPNGSRGGFEPRDCSQIGSLSPYSPAVAAAIFGSAIARIGKRCSSSRTYPKDFATQSACGSRGDYSDEPSQRNALEYKEYGRSSSVERGYDPSNMETAQPQTSPGQNLQAQPRQAFRREAHRCCRSVFESSGQVSGALGRREKPDPGSRPNSAWSSTQKGSLRHDDARLQTQRYNHLVCGSQYARRQGHRRLHASPSASRVHSISQQDRCRDPLRSRFASDRGQLWDSQASAREILAPTPPAVPSPLYPYFEFLVELGRTVVSRDHRQTPPSGKLPKRTGIDYCHQTIPGGSQPKSQSLRMERIGGANLDQNCQM